MGMFKGGSAPTSGVPAPAQASWTTDDLARALVAWGEQEPVRHVLDGVLCALTTGLAEQGFTVCGEVSAGVGGQASDESVRLVAGLNVALADPLGARPGLTLHAQVFFHCQARLQRTALPNAQHLGVRLAAWLQLSVAYVRADGGLLTDSARRDDGPWALQLAETARVLSTPNLAAIVSQADTLLARTTAPQDDGLARIPQLAASVAAALAP
jgi:hypothetical protein